LERDYDFNSALPGADFFVLVDPCKAWPARAADKRGGIRARQSAQGWANVQGDGGVPSGAVGPGSLIGT